MRYALRLWALGSLTVAFLGCKNPSSTEVAGPDGDVQFVPVVAGAAYGIGVSTEAAAAALAAGGIYVMDCTRPVSAGEVRFFCDGPAKLGQAAMNLIVASTRTLVGALHWSQANVVAHLSELSKFNSLAQLKSAVIGTASAKSVEGAGVIPQIESDSGRRNFVDELHRSIASKDQGKSKCDYVAQYESNIVPLGYKGNYMGGTRTRFLARAPSPESAETMAMSACEWFSYTLYKPAPGFAGHSSSFNKCRKPLSISGYKEKYKTADVPCPGVRVCTSESNCSDFPVK
ncbi:MAG: hypothetical protein RIR26_2672 [Pseudomonadota bacterium]|jgi:hypothetical protein